MNAKNKNASKKNMNICIITSPYNSLSGSVPVILSNFIDVIMPLAKNLIVITGQFPMINKKIHIFRIKDSSNKQNIFSLPKRFIFTQFDILKSMLIAYKYFDIIILFLGTRALPLPMILGKLLKKEIVLIGPGPLIKSNFSGRFSVFQNIVYFKLLTFFSFINYVLADHIIVYTKSSAHSMNIERFAEKIIIAPRHYVRLDRFRILDKFDRRQILVGFVGRISEEKGIINFIKSISLAQSFKFDLGFLVIGDGPLKDEMISYIKNNKIKNIKYIGWTTHEKLPHYLNKLKLLVLPSYSEGLPNILLESMACGTPVLAAPVGSIPDIIIHKENGFILKDNSPESIAWAIIESLDYADLSNVSRRAYKFVRSNYNQKKVIKIYKNVLNDL